MQGRQQKKNGKMRMSNKRIQILSIEQLLHGAQVQMPPAHGTFKQAQKVTKEEGVQGSLNLGT